MEADVLDAVAGGHGGGQLHRVAARACGRNNGQRDFGRRPFKDRSGRKQRGARLVPRSRARQRSRGRLTALNPTPARGADLLRRANAIFIEELRAPIDPASGKSCCELTSQAFAAFLPIKSLGVMGTGRTCDCVFPCSCGARCESHLPAHIPVRRRAAARSSCRRGPRAVDRSPRASLGRPRALAHRACSPASTAKLRLTSLMSKG